MGIPSGFAWLATPKVQQWAHDALTELGAGGHKAAGALLGELTTLGYPGASAALAEVAGGRWAAAIELLRPLAAGDLAARAGRRVAG